MLRVRRSLQEAGGGSTIRRLHEVRGMRRSEVRPNIDARLLDFDENSWLIKVLLLSPDFGVPVGSGGDRPEPLGAFTLGFL